MNAALRGGNFPKPIVWQPPSKYLAALRYVVFGSFGVVMLVAGVVDCVHGDLLRALFLGAIGAWFVTMVLGVVLARTVYDSDDLRYAVLDSRAHALRVNYATGVEVMVAATLVAGVLGGTLFLIGVWSDWFELPLSSREERHLGIPFVALTVVSLVQLALGVHRGRMGGIELSPTGVRQLASFGHADHAWESIAAITATDPTSRKRGNAGTMFLRPHNSGERPARLDTGGLSIGSGAAYWLVKFYFEHPELREELADGRAEARLRARVASNPR
jgi:hypothetical protein